MNPRVRFSLLCVLAIIGCSCVTDNRSSSPRGGVKSAYSDLSEEAAQYVHRLKESGRLPGAEGVKQGSLTILPDEELAAASRFFLLEDVRYPVKLTARMTSSDLAGELRYLVVKRSRRSRWELADAGRVDGAGNWTQLK